MQTASFLALGQGFYFLVTGVWPIVHIRSFMAVTGPKHDVWLVKTLGVVITAISLPLLVAGYRDAVTPEIILLANGSALGLAAVDCYYVAGRVIAPIYLADAAVEVVLVAAWVAALATTG